MKRTLIAASICIGVLGGCATTPLPSSLATKASKDRVLAFQEARPGATSTIVVTRDEGFLGSGCYYAFWINSILAARFAPGETASFFVEGGEHLLKVGRDPMGLGLCAIDQDNWTQRETIMRPNERKAFRISLDANGKPDIHRSE